MNTSWQQPRAEDFMNRQVHSVTPEMPLDDVVKFLMKHRLSNAPVVQAFDDASCLIGFLSERDCLAALANESFFGIPETPQTAATIMRRHPICVEPETELFALASIFVSHNYRHLPVTSGKKLIGIVSRRDILKAVHEFSTAQLSARAEQRRAPPDLSQVANLRFLAAD